MTGRWVQQPSTDGRSIGSAGDQRRRLAAGRSDSREEQSRQEDKRNVTKPERHPGGHTETEKILGPSKSILKHQTSAGIWLFREKSGAGEGVFKGKPPIKH